MTIFLGTVRKAGEMDGEIIDRIYESAINSDAGPDSLEGVLVRRAANSSSSRNRTFRRAGAPRPTPARR
ncbi:hypothetical protein ACO34A_23985 (plasmid) [Rhizobium sp. ACO-34A]|nr:hypothetical protein ACO34A_23985 [Rhizobium sp. ACO-34A]